MAYWAKMSQHYASRPRYAIVSSKGAMFQYRKHFSPTLDQVSTSKT